MVSNQRRCLSCRRVAPKEEFWRVVRLYPDHQVQLDHGMGRSTYLCPQASCLATAQKKNRLGRSLKATIPDQLYQQLKLRLTPETSESSVSPEYLGCSIDPKSSQ